MSDQERFTTSQIGNEIIHRWRNGQSLRSIARELGVSRERVANAVRAHQRGQTPPTAVDTPAGLERKSVGRNSKLDRFEPQLRQLLERYPRLTATRAFEELQKLGYDGGYSILRVRVKQLRVRPAVRPTVRFETAQVVYRLVDTEGLIQYATWRNSWRRSGNATPNWAPWGAGFWRVSWRSNVTAGATRSGS